MDKPSMARCAPLADDGGRTVQYYQQLLGYLSGKRATAPAFDVAATHADARPVGQYEAGEDRRKEIRNG